MIGTQHLLLGVTGQYLYLDTPRPMSAAPTAVAVFELDMDDTGATEAATTGVATLPDANDVTDAAVDVQADPKSIPVADVTGFVAGRRYQIIGGGYSETFELEAVDAAGVLYTRHPLRNDYATGAVIAGKLRAAIAVSDSWVADRANLSTNGNPNPRYRVRWNVGLTEPTETVVLYTNFDLVAYAPLALVGPLDVEDAFPGWLDMLGPDQQRTQGRALITQGQREVRFMLHGKGLAERAIRNAEVHAEIVIAETIRQTIRDQVLRGAAGDDGRLDVAKNGVDAAIAHLVASPGLALDQAGGGGATTIRGRQAPITRR